MLCACGCGEEKADPRGRFKWGHGGANLGKPDYVEEDRGYATPCWIWQKDTTSAGYGMIRWYRKGVTMRWPAHRVYYEKHRGEIPDGLELDHLCRNHACVNPEHLEPVPHALNVQRGAQAKLTWDDVRAIRASDETKAQLAERFGICVQHVQDIWSNVQWVDPDYTPRKRKRGRRKGVVYA